MNKLQITARLKIQNGNLEEVKRLANECLSLVRENEPGAIQYDWFLSENQDEFVVRETYEDSDALLAHLAIIGNVFPQLLSLVDFSAEIYGKPSEALLQATAGLNRKVYAYFQGLVPSAALL
jgi:quinol monooxygenase YgiN